MKYRIFAYLVLLPFISSSCVYETGNIGTVLSYTSNIKSDVMYEIIDTLQRDGYLKLPTKYDYLDHYDDYDHLDLRLLYFNENPEELYVATFDGFDAIRYIYSFRDSMFINRNTKLDDAEIKRITSRYEQEVLKKVVLKAEKIGYSNENIFLNIEKCIGLE